MINSRIPDSTALDRRAWMLCDLLQREKLRAAETRAALAGASPRAQRLHDAPEGIERRADIGGPCPWRRTTG